MDREEGARVLLDHLLAYRSFTYEDLGSRIGDLEAYDVESASGKTCQLEIQVVWDGRANGNIRVLAGIDDGLWSSFAPLLMT